MARRIDSFKPGETVTLRFRGQTEVVQTAVFVEHKGEGDDRKAVFQGLGDDAEFGPWEAYRYKNTWVYGSSAERLSVV